MTLKEQYESIYRDIMTGGSASVSVATNAFSWILAAQRPLSTVESLDAVAVDGEDRVIEYTDESKILEICRNLMEIDETSTPRVFRVAHLSVREFFEQHPDHTSVRIDTLATLSCLNTFSVVSRGSIKREESQGYGLYIFQHAQLSHLIEAKSSMALKMKTSFSNRITAYHRCCNNGIRYSIKRSMNLSI